MPSRSNAASTKWLQFLWVSLCGCVRGMIPGAGELGCRCDQGMIPGAGELGCRCDQGMIPGAGELGCRCDRMWWGVSGERAVMLQIGDRTFPPELKDRVWRILP